MKKIILFATLIVCMVISCSKESPIQGINTESANTSGNGINYLGTSQQPSWVVQYNESKLTIGSLSNIGLYSFYTLVPQTSNTGTFSITVYPKDLAGFKIEYATELNNGLKFYSKGSNISSSDFKGYSNYTLTTGTYSNLAVNSTNFSLASFNITNTTSIKLNETKYIGFRIKDFNGNYLYYGWISCTVNKELLSLENYGYTSASNINAGI